MRWTDEERRVLMAVADALRPLRKGLAALTRPLLFPIVLLVKAVFAAVGQMVKFVTTRGPVVRRIVSAPARWQPGGGGEFYLFLVLLLIGIGFCIWANAIEIAVVELANPCCGAPMREAGFWSAVNWSLSLVLLAPACVALLLAFANGFQETVVKLRDDGVLLDRESGGPASVEAVEEFLNAKFNMAGAVGVVVTVLAAGFVVPYMAHTSLKYAESRPLFTEINGDTFGPCPTAGDERDALEAITPPPEAQSNEDHLQLYQRHLGKLQAFASQQNDATASQGEDAPPAYPVVNACLDRSGDEMDWSVAHLFAEHSDDEIKVEEWGKQIAFFTTAVSAYLFWLGGAVALTGFLFAMSVVYWLWFVETGRSSFAFARPLDARDDRKAFPVVTALRPISVFLGGATLFAFAILYAMAVWNDYLRSFTHASFTDYVWEPFQLAFENTEDGGVFTSLGRFIDTFGGQHVEAAGGFGADRWTALLLGVIITIPAAALAAFVRMRRTSSGTDVKVVYSPGWRMLLVIMFASIMSLVFVKLGLFIIAAMVIFLARRAGDEFLYAARRS